jgi:hypothetical protein
LYPFSSPLVSVPGAREMNFGFSGQRLLHLQEIYKNSKVIEEAN